ncbi:MAG: GNAT family N-acetyltransferase [Candidatus Helarchaeota archaeon]
MKIFHKFTEEVKKAIKENHRRIFVFPNGRFHEDLLKFFNIYFKIRACPTVKALFASYRLNSNFQNIETRLSPKNFQIRKIKFSQVQKTLGKTYDILLLDLTHQLRPNELGILIETVSGGGIIFMLTPGFSKWKKITTEFQKSLISPPFSINDLHYRFTSYFIENLRKYNGIIIFDEINREIHEGLYSKEESLPHILELHKTAPFRKIFYDLAVTKDQKAILNSLEFLLQKDEKKKVMILTADRGRGKSAILGIGSIAYAHYLIEKNIKSHVKIIVTAPEVENLEVFINFTKIALKALNYKIKIRRNSLITNKIIVQYKSLIDATKDHSDLTVVDECASISLPILFNLLSTSENIIFSSTIHGYEGAGRGFSILFRNNLLKKPNLKISEIGMNEPIRYSINDPIEHWLYDTLFLNAQPVHLKSEDASDIMNSNLELKKVDLDQCFLNLDKDFFSQFAGIFVFAHYRNQPDDIVILSDSPHHEPWAIVTKSLGHIVNVVQIAKEGNLSNETIKSMLKGKQVPGNLIPWITITHFRNDEISKLKGARIVRIATHPELFQKGLGSKMLIQLEKYYMDHDFSWIGTSFGLSPELLNFWIKNDYTPIHLSSRMTLSTGEYSIVMLKPLNEKTKKFVEMLQREFKFKIFEWFRTIFYNLPPNLAFNVIEATQKSEDIKIFKIELTENQKDRLDAFINGILDYSNTSDVISQVLKYYFLNFEKDKVKLSQKQKELVILRCLQARTWQQTLEYLNMKYKVANGLLRKAIRKIYRALN